MVSRTAAYEVVVAAVDRDPVDDQRVTVIDLERVVQVERDHLRVDQVVAVVAHTGDAQRQRELGRR